MFDVVYKQRLAGCYLGYTGCCRLQDGDLLAAETICAAYFTNSLDWKRPTAYFRASAALWRCKSRVYGVACCIQREKRSNNRRQHGHWVRQSNSAVPGQH